MLFRFLICLCLWLWAGSSIAQENVDTLPKYKIKNSWYGFAIPFVKVRDEGFSPLLYRGPCLQSTIGKEKVFPYSIRSLNFQTTFGYIRPNWSEVSLATSASALRFELDYTYQMPIKLPKQNVQLYLGGSAYHLYDFRYYAFLPNNALGYEFINALQGAARLDYRPDFSQRLQFGFKGYLALLSMATRPNYISLPPYQVYQNESINPLAIFTHGNHLALPHKYFRLQTELSVIWYSKNTDAVGTRKAWKLAYAWSLWSDQVSQSLVGATHSLGVTRVFYKKKTRYPLFSKKGKKV